ncbi:hypothetical protein D623_10010447 [Myotis brandtii]|uniref:Uncharacterized protein n=1 Tax=Myotis brandtii TaxID=109478 RepID=S7MLL3_MYOBR|nr:hypothetical protein D623_10010447 [Myotis brandtii]
MKLFTRDIHGTHKDIYVFPRKTWKGASMGPLGTSQSLTCFHSMPSRTSSNFFIYIRRRSSPMELKALGRMHLEHQDQEGGRKETLAEQVDLNTIDFVNKGKSYKSQSFSSYHIFYLRISILLQ